MAKAAFGAGCFWHVQLEFSEKKGVKKATAGYMGGKIKNPTYEEVCTNRTGHVEVVQVEYDEKVISYDALLDLFWKIHDPTQGNKQGPDVGTQYRSVIFFYTKKQEEMAKHSQEKEQKKRSEKITTTIEKAPSFYPAKEYHQDYLKKRGERTCRI